MLTEVVQVVFMARTLEHTSSWKQLPCELQQALKDLDFHRPEMMRAAFQGSPRECELFTQQLCPDIQGSTVVGGLLHEVWVASQAAASQANVRAAGELRIINLASFERTRQLELAEHKFAVACEMVAPQAHVTPPPKTCSKMDQPFKTRRDTTAEGAPDARESAERALRNKWARRAMDIAVRACLPITKLASDSQRPEQVLSQVCQGKRARTLESRCRSWENAERYFQVAFNSCWPPSLGAVIDYVGAMVEGECKPSRLEGFANALAFFEKGGGRARHTRFSQEPRGKSLLR